jgi:hypothetical protein
MENMQNFPHSAFQGMEFVGDGILHGLVAPGPNSPVVVFGLQWNWS